MQPPAPASSAPARPAPQDVGTYDPPDARTAEERAAASLAWTWGRRLILPVGTIAATMLLNAYAAGRYTEKATQTIAAKLDAKRFTDDSTRRVLADTSISNALRRIEEAQRQYGEQQRQHGERLREICVATHAGCR